MKMIGQYMAIQLDLLSLEAALLLEIWIMTDMMIGGWGLQRFTVDSQSGAIGIWYGSANILAGGDENVGSADAVLYGEGLVDWFGYALTIEDVDGDGSDDLFVSAPFADTSFPNGGAVYWIPSGTYQGSYAVTDVAIATWTGLQNASEFGLHLQVGDLDADGTKDLFVSAPYASGAFSQSGSVYAFLDIASETGVRLSNTADWQIEGVSLAANTGEQIVVADITEDGIDDVLVASPNTSQVATVVAVCPSFPMWTLQKRIFLKPIKYWLEGGSAGRLVLLWPSVI